MPAVRSRGRSLGRENQPKPRSDAYTGLLLLALLAQVAGAVFLYIDWSRYPATAPEKPAALAASPSAGAPGRRRAAFTPRRLPLQRPAPPPANLRTGAGQSRRRQPGNPAANPPANPNPRLDLA